MTDILCPACGYPDWWVDNDCEVCSMSFDEAVLYLTPAEVEQLDNLLDKD